MNKFYNFLNKLEVSPFATIFIALTLISNSYKLFFIYFFITFIHELGHVLMAKLLKFKIGTIKLLAIGFNAEIEDLDNSSSIKEFLVTIAGPLTYFISYYLLGYLYKVDFISYNAYVQALQVNKYNLFFNLLPLIPLDGGRILKIIIDNFFTCKKSMIVSIIFSNIFIVIFIANTINSPQWLVYIFLILTNITYLLTINKKWKLFLIKRLMIDNKYKDKIHKNNDIYRNKNNYLIKNNNILNEKRAIIQILKNTC